MQPSLRNAIDELLDGESLRRLARLAAAQSERYRDSERRLGGRPLIASRDDALAYVAWRMPATLAALQAALEETALRLPQLAPGSLLDLGAGPGSFAWAATAQWPSLARVALLEQVPELIEIGRDLASGCGVAALESAEWRRRSVNDVDAELGTFDLVTAGYLLAELRPDERAPLLQRAWSATGGVLVIVEPGTSDGFARVRDARAQLIEAGARVVAPCPHERACPLLEPDWCHFSERVERSHVHRVVKGASLGYEDEKYAYAVLARELPQPGPARVLRRPRVSKASVRLHLCTADGLAQLEVRRRERAAFKLARKCRWGSTFEPPSEQED